MTCPASDCWCYPYYGGAPGRDFAGPIDHALTFTDRNGKTTTIEAGTFVFSQGESAPREEWPPNFRKDPACPGLGSWYCPVCLGGMEEHG